MVVRRTGSDSVSMLSVAVRVVCLLLAFSRPAQLTADIVRQLSDYLHNEYEILASQACNNYSQASWLYQTDVENKTKVDEFVSSKAIIMLNLCLLTSQALMT